MPMRNPPRPGEHVRSCREELELGVSVLAQGLGMSRQQIHNVFAGRSGITAPLAVRLEIAFGSTAESWMVLQSAYDLSQARQSTDVSKVQRFDSAPA